jgi:glycine cleavage system transcriptional repressor
MKQRFIMTAFGKDRPGITADVTRLLYENDCNLDDTTMSLLADEFTLSLLFSCSKSNIREHLTRECRRLELETGISAFVRPLNEQRQDLSASYKTCQLNIEGLDQAGIVYKTSLFLAEHALNIIHLESRAKASPESGATLYAMNIQIQVPEQLSFDQLNKDLTALADDLHVDVALSH